MLFVLDFFHGPLRSASGLPPGRPQKMAPTPCRSEPKFTSLGRMGDVHHRPSMSDASGSDCRSIFCEVMASTKRSKFRDSKAVSLLGANGFALSPIRAVFLDSSRWVVEPAGERMVMRGFFHLRPRACVPRNEDARPDLGRLPATRRLFCDVANSVLFAWEKRGPQHLSICRGLGGARHFLGNEGTCADSTSARCR